MGPASQRVAQRLAVASPDVDRQQGAGHRVEAGGEDDGVELVVDTASAQTRGRDLVDRRIAHVDQVHVGPVERGVVAGVDAHALAADDRGG